MRLADMNPSTPILVSEELAGKCDEATDLAQELLDVINAADPPLDKAMTALGVLVGQHAPDIGTLQMLFLTMEHAAVASHANKHGKLQREN